MHLSAFGLFFSLPFFTFPTSWMCLFSVTPYPPTPFRRHFLQWGGTVPPEVIYYLVFQADIFSQVTRSSSPDRGVLFCFLIVFFFFERGLYRSACVLKGRNSVCLSSGVRVDPFFFFFCPRSPAIDIKEKSFAYEINRDHIPRCPKTPPPCRRDDSQFFKGERWGGRKGR